MGEDWFLIMPVMPVKFFAGNFFMRWIMKNNRSQTIRKLVLIAVFTSFSVVLYFLKFPLPMIFPDFFKVHFANLPAIIGGFVLGPVGGITIVVLRTLLKLPSSGTFGVGELADLLIGLAVVISSSVYYKYNRTKKGGLIALLLGTAAWVKVAVIANHFIIMPAYLKVTDTQGVLAKLAVIKGINENNFMEYYILFAVIPFNLMLSIAVNIVTYFTYKKVSALSKEFYEGGKE